MVTFKAGMAALILTALFAGSDAVGAAPSKDVIIKANWVTLPSEATIAFAYPKIARAAGITGFVILDCVVGTDTNLKNCKVVTERPLGLGFGDAALSITSEFHLTPQLRNGVAEEVHARIPINFATDQPESPPVAPPTLAEAIAKNPSAVGDAREIARKLSSLDPSFIWLCDLYSVSITPLFSENSGAPSRPIVSAFTLALNDFSEERQDRVAASLVTAFSADQLKDIRNFYDTPTGQVFAAKYSEALQTSSSADRDLLLAFMDSWRAKACAASACTADENAKFDQLSEALHTYLAPPTPTAAPRLPAHPEPKLLARPKP